VLVRLEPQTQAQQIDDVRQEHRLGRWERLRSMHRQTECAVAWQMLDKHPQPAPRQPAGPELGPQVETVVAGQIRFDRPSVLG
jgi:hypothetical protein